jgi:plastocyanin
MKLRYAPALLLALSLIGSIPAAAEVHVVEVRNDVFAPADVTIAQGDVVRWVWIEGSHTTTSGSDCTPDGLWTAVIGPTNRTFEFTFSNTGLFNYFCLPHCGMGMVGSIAVLDPADVPGVAASGRAVSLAAPNPFRGDTRVRLSLPEPGPVRVAVFDAGGRQVSRLAEGPLAAGVHELSWNGRAASGAELPGGVYYVRTWTPLGAVTTTLVKLE